MVLNKNQRDRRNYCNLFSIIIILLFIVINTFCFHFSFLLEKNVISQLF